MGCPMALSMDARFPSACSVLGCSRPSTASEASRRRRSSGSASAGRPRALSMDVRSPSAVSVSRCSLPKAVSKRATLFNMTAIRPSAQTLAPGEPTGSCQSEPLLVTDRTCTSRPGHCRSCQRLQPSCTPSLVRSSVVLFQMSQTRLCGTSRAMQYAAVALRRSFLRMASQTGALTGSSGPEKGLPHRFNTFASCSGPWSGSPQRGQ
mmetsp:Transcript_147946/g.412086  ORF Transcript_147946/g.412086 Transcript_147946/m.412086 type:complete len:207 (-) Transcript_147946:410-1030(-)